MHISAILQDANINTHAVIKTTHKNCTEGSETGDSSSVCLLMSGGSDETRLTLRVLLMAFKQTGMLSVCCFPFSF